MFLNISSNHAVVVLEPDRRRLDHISFGQLSSSIVRDRYDTAIGNSRMGEDMGFELSRCNL